MSLLKINSVKIDGLPCSKLEMQVSKSSANLLAGYMNPEPPGGVGQLRSSNILLATKESSLLYLSRLHFQTGRTEKPDARRNFFGPSSQSH